MRNKFSKFAFTVAVGLALTFTLSCSGDSGGNDHRPVKKEKISGVSQKGPFVEGTTVKIYELDANLKETGNPPFEGKTDANGNFQIGITTGGLASQYVVLEVNGSYVSEVSGELSTVPVTLRAIADVSNKNNVNINVLTHLEYDKVLKLAKNGTKFEKAKRTAQIEVLTALGISESGIVNSEDMTLFGGSASDSVLLATSIILQANRSTEEVSGLLAAISEQINVTGTLSGPIKSEIANGVANVDMNEVKNHLPPNAKAPSIDDINNIVEKIESSSSIGGNSSSSGGANINNSSSSDVSGGGSSSSNGSGGIGNLVTETYTLDSWDDEQFTFIVVETGDRCMEGGRLQTKTDEFPNTINYSIANRKMTCYMGYEDTDTLLFNGASNALMGTWTRTKNKAASCGYEYCKEGYDITKAVFTDTTIAITRDECLTDREEEWTEDGLTMKIIDCNTMEVSRGPDKVTVTETKTSSVVKYNGKSCEYNEAALSRAQKQDACRAAWAEHQGEDHWEDNYYELLSKDFDACIDSILPPGFINRDDDDDENYYASSLGKVAAKSASKSKPKAKTKLASLFKRRN